MAFFQKQSFDNTQPLYEISANKNLLIVGLGNIGDKYQNTRHNIGFSVIDAFAQNQDFPTWSAKKNLHSEVSTHNMNNTKVILAKPATYMNNSGQAVQALQNFYKIKNSETLIIADELDIEFGLLRVRQGGTSAGHKGIESIIAHCGEDFYRLRVGIKQNAEHESEKSTTDFVLQKFSKIEQTHLPKLEKESISLISEFIFGEGEIAAETRKFILE